MPNPVIGRDVTVNGERGDLVFVPQGRSVTTHALEVLTCVSIAPVLWIALDEVIRRAGGGGLGITAALASTLSVAGAWYATVQATRARRDALSLRRGRDALIARCAELEQRCRDAEAEVGRCMASEL